jgi:hypothetical protein
MYAGKTAFTAIAEYRFVLICLNDVADRTDSAAQTTPNTVITNIKQLFSAFAENVCLVMIENGRNSIPAASCILIQLFPLSDILQNSGKMPFNILLRQFFQLLS